MYVKNNDVKFYANKEYLDFKLLLNTSSSIIATIMLNQSESIKRKYKIEKVYPNYVLCSRKFDIPHNGINTYKECFNISELFNGEFKLERDRAHEQS